MCAFPASPLPTSPVAPRVGRIDFRRAEEFLVLCGRFQRFNDHFKGNFKGHFDGRFKGRFNGRFNGRFGSMLGSTVKDGEDEFVQSKGWDLPIPWHISTFPRVP